MLNGNKRKIQSLCKEQDLVICDHECLYVAFRSISLISCGRFQASVSHTMKKKHIIRGAKRLWSSSIFLKLAVFTAPGTILFSVRYHDFSTGPITSPTTPIRAVMICAASLSKLLGDDIAARNKDSSKGKKAMESYTRLSNCSPRGSTPLFGLIMGITTEQGMVLGV